jgi:hypothetical protein
VASLACGHFEGESFALGDGLDVCSFDAQGQTQPLGGECHKAGVGSTGAAAQTMVEMSHRQAPMVFRRQAGEDMQ